MEENENEALGLGTEAEPEEAPGQPIETESAGGSAVAEGGGIAAPAPERGDAEAGMAGFADFAAKHPSLRAASIPDEVWAEVARGESLENAWLRYEARWTGLIMDKLAREKENSQRSTGSRRSEGRRPKSDPFDEGWDG